MPNDLTPEEAKMLSVEESAILQHGLGRFCNCAQFQCHADALRALARERLARQQDEARWTAHEAVMQADIARLQQRNVYLETGDVVGQMARNAEERDAALAEGPLTVQRRAKAPR